MQRLPTATAAGAGMTSLLVVLLLVSVLPGASGADSGPLDGRKMVFAGETAGVLARYSFNKDANVETASPPPPALAGSAAQFRGQAQLPRFAAPRRYDLRLRPDLVTCTFSGTAAVTVAVSAPTRFLVLNSADLSIDSASIRFRVRTR